MAAPHPPPSPATARLKAALRDRARAIRATLSPRLGEAASDHVLAAIDETPDLAVAGTWPLPGEMDLRWLWRALHARGQTVLLPQTPPRGQTLIFRRWTPQTIMLPERFGTMRPDGEVGQPGLIVVPFLAFDRRGHRLGYGGGYYDRTLAALPGLRAIGAGYAALRVDRLPTEPHDQALDAIYTEHGRAVPPPDES